MKLLKKNLKMKNQKTIMISKLKKKRKKIYKKNNKMKKKILLKICFLKKIEELLIEWKVMKLKRNKKLKN